MRRRTFVKNSVLTAGTVMAAPALTALGRQINADFPLVDLHVHMSGGFDMEVIMQLAEERNVTFGILEHPGQGYAIRNDDDLAGYMKYLRQYPVFVGLQPVYLNWSKDFSRELLDQLDYILMDPQTIPNDDGSYMRIWQLNAHVDDTEEFMKRYMGHSLKVLDEEPLDIFGWPLSLPICIARDYYTLWTDERKQMIIDAAKKKNIAIEINDMAHVPDREFILEVKKAGLKLTFGSDARTRDAGRLTYCKRMIEECNLTADDFFVPERKG